jgi:hypothetical protein
MNPIFNKAMKKFILSIFVLVVVVFLPACVKDKDEYIETGTITISRPDSVWEDEANAASLPTGQTVSLSIEKLYANLQKTITLGAITAENGGTVTLNNESFVDIPANACVYANTNQPCKGKVDIDFAVLKTKGDLINFDKPTISGGRLLASGGVVYIGARQGGRDVLLAPNRKIRIRFKTEKIDKAMQLFEGKATDRFKFDWILMRDSSNQPINVGLWADTVQSREPKGYDFPCDRFGWINCDKFSDDGSLTNKIAVTFTDAFFTNKNSSVYLVFKDIMSVVKLEGNTSLKQFNIPTGYKGIPIGSKVYVVALSQVGEKSYLDVQDVTISATNTIKVKQQSVLTPDEIAKKLSSL